jgi:hypothetical protein
MADSNKPLNASVRDAARRSGQTYFSSTEAREGAFRAQVERERKADEAKTTKLRALRLAREEQDRQDAANAPAPVKRSRRKKTPAVSA